MNFQRLCSLVLGFEVLKDVLQVSDKVVLVMGAGLCKELPETDPNPTHFLTTLPP